MTATAVGAAHRAISMGSDLAILLPGQMGLVTATKLDRIRVNGAPPIAFIVVVAVAAFLALALVIGAIAAYIYYCQKHHGKWPGLAVPTPTNGYYRLGCF